VKNFDVIN